MLMALLLGVSQIAAAPTTEADPDGLPLAVYQMISLAARDQDDAADLGAVTAAAKMAYPEHIDEIDGLLEFLRTPSDEPDLLLTPSTVAAADPPRWNYFRDWGGRVAFSAGSSQGNSDTSRLGLKTRLSRAEQGRVDQLDVYADTAENRGETSQRRWGVAYQIDSTVRDGIHGYLRGSHDADAFSGFEHRTFFGGGIGTDLIDRDAAKLKAELGPGYRFSVIEGEEGTQGDWVLYGALLGDWTLQGDIGFEQSMRVTLSEPTNTLVSSSSLQFRVSRAIRTDLSYEVRYETDPPEDNQRRDSIFKLDLSYGF